MSVDEVQFRILMLTLDTIGMSTARNRYFTIVFGAFFAWDAAVVVLHILSR